MVVAVGSFNYVIYQFLEVQSQIIIFYCLTIGLPLLVNACQFQQDPVTVLGLEKKEYSTCQQVIIRLLVLVMTPLIPGVLLYRKRLCRAKIEECQEKAFVVDMRIAENKEKINCLQGQNEAKENQTEEIIEQH